MVVVREALGKSGGHSTGHGGGGYNNNFNYNEAPTRISIPTGIGGKQLCKKLRSMVMGKHIKVGRGGAS